MTREPSRKEREWTEMLEVTMRLMTEALLEHGRRIVKLEARARTPKRRRKK